MSFTKQRERGRQRNAVALGSSRETPHALSLSPSYVSRINIEIGRSRVYRSSFGRVEYPYLSEWGLPADSRRNKKNHPPSWRSFSIPLLLCPASYPSTVVVVVSPFDPFLSLSFFSRTYPVSLSRTSLPRERDIFDSSLSLSCASFCSLYANPCLFTPSHRYRFLLRSRSSLFRDVCAQHRSILSGRSSLDHWPGRKPELASTLCSPSYTPTGGLNTDLRTWSASQGLLISIAAISRL